MKKRAFALLAACALLAGCGDNEGSNTTEISTTTSATGTTAAEEAESVQTDIATSEAVEQTTTAATTAKPTEEAPEIIPDETVEVIPVTDKYVELITAYDNGYLGLPQSEKIYIFQSTGKTAEIESEECHGVSCYDEHEEKLYYMCDFYINEDGSRVYRYYVAEDKYSLLPETTGFTPMDPQSQSPEEIFKEANALYGYFDLEALQGINDKTLDKEVDGSTWTYYMVADERLDTKMELINALRCYFSDDIINSLMDSSMYTEGADGKLYTTMGARGANIYHVSTEYELSILTADTAEFTAYATFGDPDVPDVTSVKEIIYNAVKRDGRWYFINFELPY